ncbi:hypothetical protein LMG27177_05957 [Paraburkholderia fynbosensis]|uniref:Uncharacterized protein n=1 Tax=Paraburkholderia fynbosensis TaxID=1200993 RepID=A0A6J5GRV7_9BURK|nr:hypothetical protein LMG27177_05957 [Paraburkholderia fynbosensis]
MQWVRSNIATRLRFPPERDRVPVRTSVHEPEAGSPERLDAAPRKRTAVSALPRTSIVSSEWKRRLRLFIQRFWQPTSACMTCMPGSWGNVMSLAHWTIALQTGLLTGLLAVLLTFTPAARFYKHRYSNALLVGLLTAIGDAYGHESHYRIPYVEHIVTGVVSALLTLAASYIFEDRARRLRAAWARVFG